MKTLLLLSIFIVLCSFNSTITSSYNEEGIASYYSDYYQGRLTANGEIFDQQKLTAAHKTLPFGTVVEVKRKDLDRKITVTINDRGPFIEGRIIDLSFKAAEELSMIDEGVVEVEIITIGK